MRENEQCAQDLVTCMCEFDSYPFAPTLRTLQSAMPASNELIVDFNSAHAAGKEKLTNFLKDIFFSKNTSIHARVPLSKCLTFAKEHHADSVKVDLKARGAEMERSALKSVISLVEESQLVDVPEFPKLEECVSLFSSSGTFRKVQKSKLLQKLSLQPMTLQEAVLLSLTWA